MAITISMGHLVISVITMIMVLINLPCLAQGRQDPYYKIEEINRETGVKMDVYSFLERNIVRSNNRCSTNWQIFYFRVNSERKIDSLRYEGTLEEKIIDQIKKNIYSTNGHWRIPKSTKSNEVYWFIYPYFDFGTHLYPDSHCPETDKVIQETLIKLSDQFLRFSTMNGGKSPYMLRPFRIGAEFDLE